MPKNAASLSTREELQSNFDECQRLYEIWEHQHRGVQERRVDADEKIHKKRVEEDTAREKAREEEDAEREKARQEEDNTLGWQVTEFRLYKNVIRPFYTLAECTLLTRLLSFENDYWRQLMETRSSLQW